jgi:hypothetical protein
VVNAKYKQIIDGLPSIHIPVYVGLMMPSEQVLTRPEPD